MVHAFMALYCTNLLQQTGRALGDRLVQLIYSTISTKLPRCYLPELRKEAFLPRIQDDLYFAAVSLID